MAGAKRKCKAEVRRVIMRRLAAIGVFAAAAFLTTAPAQAAVVQSMDIKVKVAKGDKNKKTGGATLRTTFKISDETGAKPPPLTHTTIRFPKGGKMNSKLFKKCKLANLKTKGPTKGCPKQSLIGKGTGHGDARPFIADIRGEVKLFNGESKGSNPTLLIWALPEIGPIIYSLAEFRDDPAGPYGVRMINRTPRNIIPLNPQPPMIYLSLRLGAKITKTKRVRVGRRGSRRTVKRRVTYNYLENPSKCSGSWKWRLDVEYENGEKLQPTDTVRCRK
ncbi:hypothetical protein LCGC14_2597040 [marine sediment metagenome]|uniref:Uncharacterized protein n=1 Tax=marine sediment metagenome TaxID=412755 RepID=A0A0F9CKW7_9ZZZZ